MENDVIGKYQKAWKASSQELLKTKKFTKMEISSFIQTQSKGITRKLRTLLMMDSIFKILLLLSFAVLIYLFKTHINTVLVLAILMVLTMLSIAFQIFYLKQVPLMADHSDQLLNVLISKIVFYKQKFYKVLYLVALSSPLFVLSGSLFYMYFKYGKVRPLDIIDLIVLGIMLVLSFILSVYAQFSQHTFHVRQLETCLQDLKEDTIGEQTVQKIKTKRVQFIVMSILLLVLGILLLWYFIALQYMENN